MAPRSPSPALGGTRGCWRVGVLALLLSTAGVAVAGDVVVYTSVDDVFARPIAQRFEAISGIHVKLVPDTEETKSTGLLNRLIAEQARPQADVFWSGDPVRTAILKQRGVSEVYRSPAAAGLPARFVDPDGHWTGFSARARVILYNTSRVARTKAPASVLDLGDPRFARQGCIANPLFGTTSMHAAVLFQILGDEKARAFFSAMRQNGVRMLASNGEVRRAVAAGDCALGIVDTDDAAEARREGKPVAVVYPDTRGMGTVIVPNAVLLVRHGPNPDAGRRFIDYLLSPETEAALAIGDAAQMPLREGVAGPKEMPAIGSLHAASIDYGTLAPLLDALSRGFLKTWAAGGR